MGLSYDQENPVGKLGNRLTGWSALNMVIIVGDLHPMYIPEYPILGSYIVGYISMCLLNVLPFHHVSDISNNSSHTCGIRIRNPY